jgi:hypothetical protein
MTENTLSGESGIKFFSELVRLNSLKTKAMSWSQETIILFNELYDFKPIWFFNTTHIVTQV